MLQNGVNAAAGFDRTADGEAVVTFEQQSAVNGGAVLLCQRSGHGRDIAQWGFDDPVRSGSFRKALRDPGSKAFQPRFRILHVLYCEGKSRSRQKVGVLPKNRNPGLYLFKLCR